MTEVQSRFGITEYRGIVREMIAEARHTPKKLRALIQDLLDECDDFDDDAADEEFGVEQDDDQAQDDDFDSN